MRIPRWCHKIYANLLGYFWSPCPICGRMYGGHEEHGSLMIDWGSGRCTCINCAEEADKRNQKVYDDMRNNSFLDSNGCMQQKPIMFNTKVKEGGIVPYREWNQKKYEERILKLIMKDKPPGFVMHHPFTREWIMKKPIPKIKILNILNKGGKEMKKEKIKEVSTKEKLKQLIKKLKELNVPGVHSCISIEFTRLGPISFCFLTDLNCLPNTVSLGIAVCSDKDFFTKSEGRYSALKRAYRSHKGRDKTVEVFSLNTIKKLAKTGFLITDKTSFFKSITYLGANSKKDSRAVLDCLLEDQKHKNIKNFITQTGGE